VNILHVSLTDHSGGADRAAYRIHSAQARTGLRSKMLVLQKGTDDVDVNQVEPRPIATLLKQKILNVRQGFVQKKWSTNNTVQHHFGSLGYGLVDEINSSDVDIVNLHWIADFLSIADIKRLRKPIVWTLHDMWPFCGGEHYAPDDINARFRQGYQLRNRPPEERGQDLNRKTWELKRRAWARQRFTVVSPSLWLADCARQSALLTNTPVHHVPNPLDTETIWKPVQCDAARTVLGLPLKKKLVLMGAPGGISDPRKGGDLLRAAIQNLMVNRLDDIELMIYGQSAPDSQEGWPCRVTWLGVIRDDRVLVQAYSAADVMVVPSRQDNLPNTAVEAQACGVPVVAFDVGGLSDIVEHQVTGYLAQPFDTSSLADGIGWVLDDKQSSLTLKGAARESAVRKFANNVVARAYNKLYEQVLAGQP